jgi:hypothetical protein
MFYDFLDCDFFEIGFRDGFSLGVDQAITDTRYNRPRDDYLILDNEDFLFGMYNKGMYRMGYTRGYESAYNQVYRRHDRVLHHLRHIHQWYNCKLALLHRFGCHPLLDPQLIEMIERYVPDEPINLV